MRRFWLLPALAITVAALPSAALGHHELPLEALEGSGAGLPSLQTEDDHSPNMSLVANWNDDGNYRQGSDLAFWGDTAVVGNFGNPGGFHLLDISRPDRPKRIGQFVCPGSQADVSIWNDLVFVSVDATMAGPECGAGAAPAPQVAVGDHWEGIRVVSIANPAEPQQIAAVYTDCGSHTHTLVPDRTKPGKGKPDRLLLYSLSYPLSGQGAECNVVTHRKISVVEVPLDAPQTARVVSTPDVSPAIGCHDVTVFPEHDLAGAACISESQLWDISDPVNPRIISHIYNPAINIHHSTTFSWDAQTLVIGDELGGALFTPGCMTAGEAPMGAMWFYDVSNPATPQLQGFFQIPQVEPSIFCGVHNFNTVPLRNDRDILVSAGYNGGTFVVDFTDPANPQQLGYYIARDSGYTGAWSSYWYNGLIYQNNFDEDVNSLTAHSRGFDVFKIDHPNLKQHVKLPHLNPQTQETFPGIKGRGSR